VVDASLIVILLIGFAFKREALLAPRYFWQGLTKKRSAGTT